MSALELHSPQAVTPPTIGRFRVIDRRRPAIRRRARRRVAHPFRAAFIYTAFPALLLVIYVALWTTAVHAGYQEQRLKRDIERLRVENQSLQAQERTLQSSARILHRAKQLGMQPPQQIEAVHVP
jgi:cell division protein FtsL